MPRKIRDYKDEYEKYHSKTEEKKDRAKRNTARRRVEKEVGKTALKGKDVDHKTPLRKGGTNARSNLRVRSRSTNRSDNGQRK